MNKFTIKDITIEHFVGILGEEKKKKNKIVIDFTYTVKKEKFINYKEIYDYIINCIFSKKWDYIEDIAEYLSKHIFEKFPLIININIKIKKMSPLYMDLCREVILEYEKEK